MPIYEYQCPGCRHEFELLLRGGETAACPQCGGQRLEKQFSVPAAHTHAASSLPICDTPAAGGGCGLPQCGQGRCGM